MHGRSLRLRGVAASQASLAVDVGLFGTADNSVHCPNVPVDQRPVPWQLWASVLDKYEDVVRDGGDFAGRRDVVHMELRGWNVLDHTYA